MCTGIRISHVMRIDAGAVASGDVGEWQRAQVDFALLEALIQSPELNPKRAAPALDYWLPAGGRCVWPGCIRPGPICPGCICIGIIGIIAIIPIPICGARISFAVFF